MTNSQKIKLALTYAKVSEAELARRLGTTSSAFNQRMQTDKFAKEELEKIATALGAEYESVIKFPDGTNF